MPWRVTLMKKLGILLSGRGSNFEAIARNVQAGKIPAEIAVVISNKQDAVGLARAREMGFKHVASAPMVRSSYHADEFTPAASTMQ